MKRSEPSFRAWRSWLDEALMTGAFPCAGVGAGGPEEDFFRLEACGAESSATGFGDAVRVYDLASLSKWLATALAALRLVDAGTLRLDAALGRFWPEVPEEKREIRIKDLLCHTAGFEPYFLMENCGRTPEEVVEIVLQRPLQYRPRTGCVYSCIGFILLGKVLELIAGMSLDSLARELVFDPLGMRETMYLPVGRKCSDPGRRIHAMPTEKKTDSSAFFRGVVHDENARFLGGVSGNAGLFASLKDCMRYGRLFLNRCEGFLKPATFEAMTRNQTPGLGAARGLGVSLRNGRDPWPGGDRLGKGAFGHTGFTGTSLYISPEHALFCVLLTNRVHFGRDIKVMPDYRARFHAVVLEEFGRFN